MRQAQPIWRISTAQVAIGQSATHQISHTKGGVIDGILGFHGSVNWSASGEGTFVAADGPGGSGYKAQNNTLSYFTDRASVNGFRDELAREHAVAVAQMAKAQMGFANGAQKIKGERTGNV